ncbi:hypothetical protein KY331_02820 [Candidatus Woesearchaeota archaeon]|nr:hypothetical protein [Candidatus Woesearchaeota archaeon]
MNKITRRGLIKAGIGTGVAAGSYFLARALGFDILASLFETRFSREEYADLVQKVKKQGYEIDESHSVFNEGSDAVILFLPDIHTISYAKSQRERITKLDSAIDFDMIGLEGIVGEIDVEHMKELAVKQAKFYDDNVIPRPTIFKLYGEEFEFEIKESDTDFVKLQKLRYKSDEIRLEHFDKSFVGLDIFQNDLQAHIEEQKKFGKENWRDFVPQSEESKRYQAYSDFVMALGFLSAYLPLKRSDWSRHEPLLDYEFVKEVGETKPRHDAPGFLYFDLETRAKKWGIETEDVDDCAAAYCLQINISRIEQQMDKVAEKYNALKDAYFDLLDEDGKRKFNKIADSFNEYFSFFKEYMQQIKDYRDELLSGFSDDVKSAILECEYDPDKEKGTVTPDYERLVVKDRSEEWVKNTANKGVVLMIGGLAHTQTVYDSVKSNNCSIISLKEIE